MGADINMDVIVTSYMSELTRNWIEEEAKRNCRTISSQIRYMCEQWILEHGGTITPKANKQRMRTELLKRKGQR